MTLLEAHDRATRLWRKAGIHGGIERVSYWGPLGYRVELAGDGRLHFVDCNGHIACKHEDCLARERQVDAVQ